MLHFFTALKDSSIQSDILNEYGYFNYKLGNFNKSIHYYQHALKIDEAVSDTIRMIGRFNSIGMMYLAKGLNPLAIQYYTEALALAQTIHRPKSIAFVSNSIGLLMYEMEQYSKALAYYRTALRAWTSLQDTLRMAYAYNNMGQVYYDLQQYDNALIYFRQAKQWKEDLNEHQSLATTLHNLGSAYLALDSITQASNYLHESYTIADTYEDKHELATVSNDLAALYLHTENYPRARYYLNTAHLLIEELGSRMVLLEYWRLEAQYHEAVGQLAKALAFQKQWAALQDSLYHEERLQVVELQAAYSLQQEEQARKSAEAERETALAQNRLQRTLLWIAIIAKFIFIGLCLLLYRLYRAYRRTSKQNELLVKEQHHRVKNNLNVISSLLRMHARRLEDEGAKQAMAESQLRILTMELIHRRLYEVEITHVAMQEYIEALVQEVLTSYGYRVHLQLMVEDSTLPIDKAAPVGLIINEVVSNACKYAFPDHPHPKLRVQFGKKTANTYQLRIHDNGRGMEIRLSSEHQSFGHKLIRLLTEQLRGRHHYEQQDGTLFQLTFSK
ncbi:MAG: tetratricopeptide repeat protein [Cyclobacteriaceae bacterium]